MISSLFFHVFMKAIQSLARTEVTSDSWIVVLQYLHSTHSVEVDLGSNPISDNLLGKALLFGISIIIAASLAAVYVIKKKRN